MTRAIVSGGGAFYQKLFSYMHDHYGWSISGWIVDQEQVSSATRLFPKALIIPIQELNAGVAQTSLNPCELPPLDQKIVDGLMWCEPIVMEMMDRIDSTKTLRYDERLRLFQFHIRYWLLILERDRPDVFFSPYAPHEVCDFVLFALCRFMQIPTMMFEWTSLPGLRLLIADYRDLSKIVTQGDLEKQKFGVPTAVSPASLAELSRLRSDYQKAMPGYFVASQGERTKNVLVTRKRSFISRIKTVVAKATKLHILMETDPKYLNNLYYREDLPPELTQRSPTRFERSLHSRSVMNAFQIAEELYGKLSVEPDLNKPYVYLALHFQPERTTCPCGGMFSDQRLVVSLLANTLPEGWVLYVKEHPSQFVKTRYGYLARSPSFYLDIASHKNVRFIKQGTPQFDLIDRSQVVATITGTSGWEALVRGKPAFVFGDAWYQGCQGAYRIRTRENCKDSFKRVIENPAVSKSDVEEFVAEIEKVAIKVYLGEDEASWSNEKYSESQSIEICAQAIANFFATHKLKAP